MSEGFGRENDEIGHRVAVLGQIQQHLALVADFLYGKIPVGQRGDNLIIFLQGVGFDIVDDFVAESPTLFGQKGQLFWGGSSLFFGQEKAEEEFLSFATRSQEHKHIIPTRRELMLLSLAVETVYNSARLIAFQHVV